jgi:hypothetical protein
VPLAQHRPRELHLREREFAAGDASIALAGPRPAPRVAVRADIEVDLDVDCDADAETGTDFDTHSLARSGAIDVGEGRPYTSASSFVSFIESITLPSIFSLPPK